MNILNNYLFNYIQMFCFGCRVMAYKGIYLIIIILWWIICQIIAVELWHNFMNQIISLMDFTCIIDVRPAFSNYVGDDSWQSFFTNLTQIISSQENDNLYLITDMIRWCDNSTKQLPLDLKSNFADPSISTSWFLLLHSSLGSVLKQSRNFLNFTPLNS